MLAKSPVIAYLPPGTYLVSDTIVLWFWSSLVGNPLCRPTLLLGPNTPGYDGHGGSGGGIHKPIVAANGGFNTSASRHAWWLMGTLSGGNANDLFYTMIRDVNIVVQQGNEGAVGIFWPVAQQTSIRDVFIDMTASGAIGIDEGGSDYVVPFSPSFNAGGGGVIDSVTVHGGTYGLRLDGSQWTYRDITLSGATQACITATDMLWAMTFIDLKATNCPTLLTYGPSLGVLTLLDSTLGPGLGESAILWSQGSMLVLQNVAVYGQSTTYVVNGTLPASATGFTLIPLWVAGGPVYMNGMPQGGGAGGYLPLPSLAAAKAAGITPACNQGQNLCGGSSEYPATGIPSLPRPSMVVPPAAPGMATGGHEGGQQWVNVLDYGAVGDGVHDDTAALRAAFAASPSVFLPYGTYAVSDTITVPCNGTLLGEALSTLALLPNAPGYGDNSTLKAMLASVDDGSCGMYLADLSLSTLGPGNEGALLLDWRAGADSSAAWDVTIRLYWAVGLKARFSPPSSGGTSGGGGYLSNTWFWAADHNLTDLVEMTCTDPSCVDHKPVNTPYGVLISTTGPFFMLGTDFEHSLIAEYQFVGASNVVATHSQTENTPLAVSLVNTSFVTLYSALNCLWETRVSPALYSASRVEGKNCVQSAGAGAAGRLDVSYRLLGLLERQTGAAIVDALFPNGGQIPGNTKDWVRAAAIINTCP